VVTISLGIAKFDFPRSSVPSDLIKAADRALFQAKKSGRNRIAVAAP
jgi:diguanylate cyclase (GGDEF)-like protein